MCWQLAVAQSNVDKMLQVHRTEIIKDLPEGGDFELGLWVEMFQPYSGGEEQSCQSKDKETVNKGMWGSPERTVPRDGRRFSEKLGNRLGTQPHCAVWVCRVGEASSSTQAATLAHWKSIPQSSTPYHAVDSADIGGRCQGPYSLRPVPSGSQW